MEIRGAADPPPHRNLDNLREGEGGENPPRAELIAEINYRTSD